MEITRIDFSMKFRIKAMREMSLAIASYIQYNGTHIRYVQCTTTFSMLHVHLRLCIVHVVWMDIISRLQCKANYKAISYRLLYSSFVSPRQLEKVFFLFYFFIRLLLAGCKVGSTYENVYNTSAYDSTIEAAIHSTPALRIVMRTPVCWCMPKLSIPRRIHALWCALYASTVAAD